MVRPNLSLDLSSRLVDFLIESQQLTQEELADRLEVSPAFISRVRRRERSFTIEHLHAVEALLGKPLGAILLTVSPMKPSADPKIRKLQELARQTIEQADKVGTMAQKSRSAPGRKRSA